MSLTAGAWIALFGVFTVLAFRRAIWAVALYMLTFFAAPHLWWWGDEVGTARYALYAGLVLLVAVIWEEMRVPRDERHRFTLVHAAALAMAVNATLVHFFLASNRFISLDNYIEFLKFILLFFLMWFAIRSRRDLRLLMLIFALGAGYIGYEVTINERGHFSGSRLEDVGAPGADAANSLACLMLTLLPLIGSLFVHGTKREKLVAVVTAPLALNVLLLCNSRGAFIGLMAAGFVFLLIAKGTTRKKAIKTLLLGAAALYLLLGDPKILDRFTTTFVGAEERDRSAASRIEFWHAGALMVADYPLGAGGGAFKYIHGGRYLARVGSDEADRSLHNGYLTEATDWGLQGLGLKLLFFAAAIVAAYRTSTRCRLEGRVDEALIGVCVVVAAAGYLIHCMFGSFLSNEWGYWMAALLLRYAYLFRFAEAPAVARGEALIAAESAPQTAA
jgi:hypothetical protein